jgi:transposase-like protein
MAQNKASLAKRYGVTAATFSNWVKKNKIEKV